MGDGNKLINIDSTHDPKTGGYVVSFDAPEVPERIVVRTYKPPFYGAVFVRDPMPLERAELGNAIRGLKELIDDGK